MLLPWLPQIGMLNDVPVSVVAALFFGAGVLLLLFGWHIYRVALVVLGVLTGGAIGALIAHLVGIHVLYLAIPLGIVAGVLTAFLEGLAAFFAGGLCGALGMMALLQETGAGRYVAVGLAFLIGGLLAIFLWRPMIIISLSVVGAVSIANALLLAANGWTPGSAERFLSGHPYLFAAGLAFLTVCGVIFQSIGEKPEGEEEAKGKQGTRKSAPSKKRPAK